MSLTVMAEDAVIDTSRVINLDEVIVVSQPKEGRSLRYLPLSSSVYTSNEMQQLNVRDLSQLSSYVPSFMMPQYGSRLTSSIYVRGIGSRVNNPSVGVYYDNIPLQSKSAYNTHFYGIDRVDVLRGAQGTLYGMNTEGGLVRIYSKNPMQYQGTDLSLGFTSGMQGRVELAHYHHPTEHFAFSAAMFYNGQRGFFKNQNIPDEYADLMNEAGGRMRFIWAPNARLKFDLTSDYQFTSQNAFPYGIYNVDKNRVAAPSTTVTNGYKRSMLNNGLSVSYETGSYLLTSMSSWQYLYDNMRMDQDYLPEDYLQLKQKQKQQALTQEFAFRSKGNKVWQHTTGVFGSYQWLRTDASVDFGPMITDPIGNAVATAMKNAMIVSMMNSRGLSREAAAAIVERMGITMTAEMAVPEVFRTPQYNIGIYHESNFRLGDRLTATLGLRYDYNKVKIDYDALAYMTMIGGVGETIAAYALTSHLVSGHSKAFSQLLPKVGLTYQWENGSNVYASVNKGFRAGGYNMQMFSDILQTELDANSQNAMRGDYDVPHTADDYNNVKNTIEYKPEESWNYEVGTHQNLFDGKVHADLSIYYMQIRNQQLSVMAGNYGYGRMMVNAGHSSSCGAELSLRGKAISNLLDWGVNYSYTHATFRRYTDDNNGAPIDYSGNHVPYVPEHIFSALVDYRIPLKGDMPLKAVIVGVNTTGNGSIYWDEANTYKQKFYVLLGAHTDLDFGWARFSLWGRNITDTRYATFAVESKATGTPQRFAQRGTPIVIGCDLNIHL